VKNLKDKTVEIKIRIYNWILKLIKLLKDLPSDTCTKIIIEQLLRSGTSIGANYIEAQAASSKRDFTNFIHHSLKSANESKFWLALLRDTNKAKSKEINELLEELKEIANILGASLLTLKGKR
jgi:four helix bundle protein